MANQILERAVTIIRKRLGPSINAITVERVAIGRHFAAVKLSDGSAGACAIPYGRATAWEEPTSPDGYRGLKASSLLALATGPIGSGRSLGIATLNALAQPGRHVLDGNQFELLDDVDALQAARIEPAERVVLVGALLPFMRALQIRRIAHKVLEMDRSSIPPDHIASFVPASQAAKVVPGADVLIVTGATLANDTLGDIIAPVRPHARIAVVGPSVPLVPEAFTAHGCGIIGGIRVIDADAVLDVVGDGGKGFHLMDNAAIKVTVRALTAVRASYLPAQARSFADNEQRWAVPPDWLQHSRGSFEKDDRSDMNNALEQDTEE